MAKSDLLYNELIKKIKEEGKWDTGKDVRGVYADGSPAYTKSVFGVQIEFPKEALPLITSKKVFGLTAAKESLLF